MSYSAGCNKVSKTKTEDEKTSGVTKGFGVQGDTNHVSFQESIQMSFIEALAQESIEGKIDLSDMSVILDAVLESFIPGHGWIPCHSFDPH